MVVLILANVWRSVAFPMILFLAALQGIPENLYRAARVDGIPWWMTFPPDHPSHAAPYPARVRDHSHAQ